ncbi:MAG TPA: hypothetical protein VKX49_29860 [Bryobacteraceae bacterium]|nr:hypothetical protein [Bryobacteraceae bacterium]
MQIARHLALSGIFLAIACSHRSEINRPESVPPEAVLVSGKMGRWWQMCRAANAGDVIYCRIWSAAGLIRYDDQFVPYDAAPMPTIEELRIASHPALAGPDWVVLTNKRILLPKSHFNDLKKHLDSLSNKVIPAQ